MIPVAELLPLLPAGTVVLAGPTSGTVDAVRACTIGGPTATYVFKSILWSIGIIAVFAPIAVRKYRRVA